VGPIKALWLEKQKKLEIFNAVRHAKKKGISITNSCRMWQISRRRVTHWNKRYNQDPNSLKNLKPGPRTPINKLLPVERRAVIKMAKAEQFADLSHRLLTITAWDLELFFVSFSSVYRILCSEGLMSMRGPHRGHNGKSLPPVRKQLTGANQRWCWDISYLPTYQKGLFLYLYLLLDEHSRKIISWLISWHQSAEQARELIESGLINENILDLCEDQRPEVVNDRGRQMKAASIKQMFKDNHMPQLFARPRTPNDNPFVESLFGTVKTAPEYPGRFLDRQQAVEYFKKYFTWYNTEHLHSGIDYVTPEQCHRGMREKIVKWRTHKLKKQQQLRKEVNRLNHQQMILSLTEKNVNPISHVDYSVMTL
jgi:transposase InsO family protein